MKIESRIDIGKHLMHASQDEIKNEPMLHRATVEFAEASGGPLTHAFIIALGLKEAIIDSRVHMLMPGMFPCIPGWHHDDVPRERSDGQPNYDNPSYKSKHCMALWGDCSLTEFAIGTHDIEIPVLGKKIYKELSGVVESDCEREILTRVIAPERRLIFFNWNTWHQGKEATKKGFRFFIRATWDSNLMPRNEIRQNANVYMPILTEGW
jgi:hypothetical protein